FIFFTGRNGSGLRRSAGDWVRRGRHRCRRRRAVLGRLELEGVADVAEAAGEQQLPLVRQLPPGGGRGVPAAPHPRVGADAEADRLTRRGGERLPADQPHRLVTVSRLEVELDDLTAGT